MKADFLDAHKRHLHDAELLFTAERWANADHLFGFAAECGLKRLMIMFGMEVDDTGTPHKRSDRVHVMEIRKDDNTWDRYESYRSGIVAANYSLPGPNPFANWDASQRYAHHSNFTRQRVELHRNAALEVQHLIDRAIREGRI